MMRRKLLGRRRGGTWANGSSFMRWKATKFNSASSRQRRKNKRLIDSLPLEYEKPLRPRRASGRRRRTRRR